MPRTRRRRIAVNTVCALLTAAATTVALRPGLLTDHLPDGLTFFGTETVDTLPLPAEPERGPSRAEPFRGSPALRWADGAAGIVLPEARATGGLRKARVEGALRDTRDFLIAANLDPATLRGERPQAALDLIDPADRTLLDRLDTPLAKPSEKHDPLMMFSRFDPAEVVPAGPVVKTRGRTTFEAGERPGSVEIHADYTFVLPVTRVRVDAEQVVRTIARRVLTVEVSDPATYEVTPGKIWIAEYRAGIYNSSCTVFDGYLHPSFPGDAPEPGSSGPGQDPYVRSTAGTEPEPGECAPVSRT
ncbi:hypothetical protein ACIQVA_26270 [Streptomyces microflavus]|uniref:hypothetical protein n=1 Tax=Streptomyces microflavus TaxID=1919 RepID=UPI0037F3AC4D